MEKRFFSQSEVLFAEGDKSDVAYIVKEGSVALNRVAPRGMTETIATIDAGNIIGEVSLITGAPHSVTAVALEDGQALVLTRAEYDQRLARSDKVLTMILKSVVGRLRRTYT